MPLYYIRRLTVALSLLPVASSLAAYACAPRYSPAQKLLAYLGNLTINCKLLETLPEQEFKQQETQLEQELQLQPIKFIQDDRPTTPITAIAFSPNGKYAITGEGPDHVPYHYAHILNLTSGETKMGNIWGNIYWTFGLMKHIDSIAFSGDSKYVLMGENTQVAYFRSLTKELPTRSLIHRPGNVSSVALSLDGSFALTGSTDAIARLWDTAKRNIIMELKGHTGTVSAVAFSSDDKFALTGSYDTTVRLWSVPSGRLIQVFANNIGPVLAVAFTPDTKHALVGAKEGINFWKIPNEDTFVIEELILKLQENQ